ncbi:MAG: dihydrofolate reductase [Pseudomonadota bacterium]|nr:dihydrofolate reductase [Pseudomonadota bacterium]
MTNAAVELVVAAAENDAIGRAGRLPWHLPADLRHFKALTLGHHILMGRKTYESIGKALPGRTNWVLSRSPGFAPADCKAAHTLADAQSAAGSESPLMVIGGAEVYRLCLSSARRIHLTLVHSEIKDGDTFFADWRGPEWVESSRRRHEADANNAHAYSFITLDRAKAPKAAGAD